MKKVLMLVLLIIMMIFGYIYLNDQVMISQTREGIPLSLEDIVGFIKIENIDINRPLMQFDDNYFYLNHDYMRKENENGEYFLDFEGDLFNNTNSIIYTDIDNINIKNIAKNDSIEILYLNNRLCYKVIDINESIKYKNDLIIKVINNDQIINILAKYNICTT